MSVDLAKLVIDAPLLPTRTWNLNDREWEDYKIRGFINGLYVAQIKISRALNTAGRYNDIFFFDLNSKPPTPKPFVCYQETEEQFKGKGISGRLIILTNEFYKGRLGTNLHSDTIFIPPSRRVWEKLQNQGLAEYNPYQIEIGDKLDRWVIL